MRELILAALMNKIGEYVSGQELCRALDCTRAAIWKQVQGLREDGYRIEASPRLGYKLRVVPDIIEPFFIKQLLETRLIGREVVHLKKTDSTNLRAKFLADCGAPHGTLILAEEQTAGRGRMGNTWTSPPGKSLLISLVLRPKLTVQDAQKITMMAAVAMAQAMESCGGITPGIKWPNDILIGNKKVCGILTEMSTMQHEVCHVVLGVGVNVSIADDEWPPELAEIATSLDTHAVQKTSRVPLIVAFCNNFEVLYERYLQDYNFAAIMEIYRPYSVTLAREVRIQTPNGTIEGTALYFDDDGMLVVLNRAGGRERVLAGDVHVRGLLNQYWE